MSRWHQIVEMIEAEKNRLPTVKGLMGGHIQPHIDWLQQQLSDLAAILQEAIRQSPLWQE